MSSNILVHLALEALPDTVASDFTLSAGTRAPLVAPSLSSAQRAGDVIVPLGTPGDDLDPGTPGDDSLSGEGGNDTLSGGAGNDTILGGEGNDLISGGAGNDSLDGGLGVDTVDYSQGATAGVVIDLLSGVVTGGAGNDTLSGMDYVRGSEFADSITGNGFYNFLEGGGGNDTLRGGDTNDDLVGGDGDDLIDGQGNVPGSSFDIAWYNTATSAVTVNMATGLATGGGGNDTLVGIEGVLGSAYGDSFIGGAGNDFFTGGAGNDTMDGGDGFDFLQYSNAGSAVQVNLDNGEVTGGAGIDVVSNFESVLGSAYGDSIVGNDAGNFMRGRAGDDTIDGGAGIDRAAYDSQNVGAVNVSLDSNTSSGADGTDTLISIENLRGSNFNDTLTGNDFANDIQGGLGNDLITGGDDTDGLDVLNGQGGNDTLDGGVGRDNLYGEDGNDSLIGGAVLDRINYLDANFASWIGASNGVTLNSQTGVVLDGRGGTDSIEDINLFYTSALADTITGSTALIFEQFEAGAGNDVIDGGVITDTLNFDNSNRLSFESAGAAVTANLATRTASGGAGDDTFSNINMLRGSNLYGDTLTGSDESVITEFFEGRGGSDNIDGAGGNDIVRYDSAAAGVVVNLADGTAQDGDGGTDTLAHIEGVRGSAFDDSLSGGNTANGTGEREGLEVFEGRAGDDRLDGGAGYDRADYQNTLAAVNVTLGGAANGTASDGYGGTDTLIDIEGVRGSTYDDTLTGSDDADQFESFEGREGNDTMDGNGGTDRADYTYARAGVTANLATGTASDGYGGTDTLRDIEDLLGSRDFNDSLTGSGSANLLEGQGGDDFLVGDAGADTLLGGSGHEYLVGGAGVDAMDGGDDFDEVLFYDATQGVVVDMRANTGSTTLISFDEAAAPSLTGFAGAENSTLVADPEDAGNQVAKVVKATGALFYAGTVVATGANDTVPAIPFSEEHTVMTVRVWSPEAGTVVLLKVEDATDVDKSVAVEATTTVANGWQTLSFDFAAPISSSPALDLSTTYDRAVIFFDFGNVGTGKTYYFDDITFEGAATGEATIVNDGFGNLESLRDVEMVQGSAFADTIRLADNGGYVFGRAGNDKLIGGVGNDTFLTGSGNDTQNGGDGVDTADYTTDAFDMAGLPTQGAVVNLAAGTATDNWGATDTLIGIENVIGSVLADNLTGDGGGNLLDGAAGNDSLQGGSGKDTLLGGEGADSLDGGTGNDSMTGGAGNDRYQVDAIGDRTMENPSGGNDLVTALIDHTLAAEVERLVLGGAAAIDGTGNELANTVTGNTGANGLAGAAGNDTLVGGDGHDTLDGGDGNDSMTGGSGNDRYLVDSSGDVVVEASGGGTDTVSTSLSLTLAAEVEHLTITGSSNRSGTGNTLANQLTGNSGNNNLLGGDGVDTLSGGAGNDTLDGGSGADSLVGGSGNDSYLVNNSGDLVIEASGGGSDRVTSTASAYTLAAEVEKLTLGGSGDIKGTGNAGANTLTGNSGANLLAGGDGVDTLVGGDGNDSLDGGSGADSLTGGAGDDVYNVNNNGDLLVEVAGGGIDTVNSSTTFTLATELEHLVLTGGSGLGGTGNGGANRLTGNTGANALNGAGGADTLTGGAGNDSLSGGGAADQFELSSLTGSDTLGDFVSGTDKILVSQAGISVGNGNTTISGAVKLAGPGGFSASAELVIISANIAGSISKSAAAAQIGSATSAYAVGRDVLFAVDNGSSTALYLFTAADANAVVSSSELTLLATLTTTAATSVGDFLFGA